MICFVTTRSLGKNLKPLLVDPDAPKIAILYYDDALAKTYLPRATYIFTAMGHSRPRDHSAAARLFRRLQEHGCRALNDPARVRTRLPLLRALHRVGINSFNVYSVEEEEKPKRFPVFVRVSHGSRPPLTDLIWDQATLDRAVEAAIVSGTPRQSLMIVEYSAQPVRPGVFRKGSVHRIGNHFVPDIWWYGTSWIVKGDQDGLADEELYAEELQMMRHNTLPENVERAFEIANIDYGRLDFGLVDGRPCIYEINTNPQLFGVRHHRAAQRAESIRLKWTNLITALHAIDTPGDAEELIEVAGESIESLTNAASSFPALRLHHLRVSEEHERRGDISAALAAAEAEVEANPDSVKALSQLSQMLIKHDRLDDAITVLKRSVKLSPRNIREQRRLAALLWESGRLEEMRNQLREALVYGADQWQIHLLLSRVHQKLVEHGPGLEAATRAAQLAARHAKPNNLAELAELSRILTAYGRIDDAIAVLELAVQLVPNRSRNRRRLAALLIKAGRFEEARDHLFEALPLEEHWNTYFLLSRVHGKLGDQVAELEAVKHAAQLAPHERAVVKRLQRLMPRRSNFRPSSFRQWSKRLLRLGSPQWLKEVAGAIASRAKRK